VSINEFEAREKYYREEAIVLGETIRKTMSWEIIYGQYRKFMNDLLENR
jgi:hypothetical protein